MTDRLRFTLLGCGSSPGTPRITGDWGACDPHNPKNRRTRAAAMVERIAEDGAITRVVIDTGPDFRQQMLAAGVGWLHSVVYTHAHADHIHGIDDLRGFVLEQRRRVDVYADEPTMARLQAGFGYCFATPPGSSYPPIVKAHLMACDRPLAIDGDGGPLVFEPLRQMHGDSTSLGFRIAGIGYCPDVSGFPPETAELLSGLDLLVIDALQHKTHPSHFSLGEALAWIERLKPERAILTHMHVPLDYEAVRQSTPPQVEPGFDGMVVEVPLETGDWHRRWPDA